MARFGIYSAVILFVLGMAFFWKVNIEQRINDKIETLEKKKAELEKRMLEPGIVVYCNSDKPAGAIFAREDGVEKSIPQMKVPQNAVARLKDAVGKKLAYGVYSGQILSDYDFDPPLNDMPVHGLCADRDLRKDEVVREQDFYSKPLKINPNGSIEPAGAVKYAFNPYGKKLKHDLKKDSILMIKDLK